MTLYLGIDAGGTRTRARLISDVGQVLGSAEAGAANTPEGLPRALASIEDASTQALADAGLSRSDADRIHAGMGVAGLNRRGMLKGLQEHGFPFRSTAFASDAAIANLGAHGGEDGGIVIVGTGSVGFGRVGATVITIGGYGFPVSDEGSGAELGLRAVRRALWARDGRLAHSPMTLDVLERFHGSAGEIVDWTACATPSDYGTFAPLVLEHAMKGEPVAEAMVQESARRIEAIVHALLERGVPTCCLMGGLAAPMRDWLSPSIREHLRDPIGDALDGAVLLARTRAGQDASG